MSKTLVMVPRPLISGNLFHVIDEDDPGTDSIYRIAIDSEDPNEFAVHMKPAGDQEDTGEMSVSLYLNLHNATALRDELTRHIEWHQANGTTT